MIPTYPIAFATFSHVLFACVMSIMYANKHL